MASRIICAAQTDDVKFGVLRLQDFIVGSNPLSNAGFGTFNPELTQLVGPGGVAVPDEQVVFQVNPPGTPLITLQLRPSNLNPDTQYELSILVDPSVRAVSYTGFRGVFLTKRCLSGISS